MNIEEERRKNLVEIPRDALERFREAGREGRKDVANKIEEVYLQASTVLLREGDRLKSPELISVYLNLQEEYLAIGGRLMSTLEHRVWETYMRRLTA